MVGSDEPIGVERPLAPPEDPAIGRDGDAIAEILRRPDLPFISPNPGASHRGRRGSLVNDAGTRAPEIVGWGALDGVVAAVPEGEAVLPDVRVSANPEENG